jgi:hypothetical protein
VGDAGAVSSLTPPAGLPPATGGSMLSAVGSFDAGQPSSVRTSFKNAALEKAMRHLGLYNRDNNQRSENLSLQVVLVGAPTNERE